MILTSRREFVTRIAAAGVAAGPILARPANHKPVEAIAFDAFPILDPSPIFALARTLFPERGQDLVNLWRVRQFEYTWLRSLSRRYANFWEVTREALVFAAKSLNIDLTGEHRDELMGAYLKISCWPDVPAALKALRQDGIRIAFLSNMTEEMLQAGIANAHLSGLFEHVLSTDRVKTYKPDPRAYQMGPDALGLKREQILFAAFAGWDAAGAKAFGYPTYWVNRQNQPAEELGLTTDAAGSNLNDLLQYLPSIRQAG